MPERSEVIVLVGPMGVGKTTVGRQLARRYADVLQNVVDDYCTEFEKRAEAALARLEAAA